MRTAAFLALLSTTLLADVAVLKENGEKVAGKIVDKGNHWEVTTEQGLRTYLKEEVDRILTDPKEFLGDADSLYEQAKKDYEKGNALTAPAEQNSVFREAIAKLVKAREAYGNTRDLFPEDKYSEMDKRIVQIMMLLRILRGSMSSETARGPAVNLRPDAAPRVERPASVPGLQEAFAILADPARRGDAGARKTARDSFRDQRAGVPDLYDLATAGMLLLGRPDADWRLAGPSLAAFQEYAAKPWLKDPLKLTPATHQAAAAFLAEKIAAVKKADANASTEALGLLALGHLGCAPAGPESEKAARALGLMVTNGIPGTPEGQAVRDLGGFLQAGDYDLAHRAFVNDYRSLDTPSIRFAWSWGLLQTGLQKRKGMDRPVSALNGMKGDAAALAHAAALAKSIQVVTPCSMCAGDGWLRCTNCHGQKTLFNICKVCAGTRIRKNNLGNEIFCIACRMTGIASKLECHKCKDGYFKCPKCKLPDCKACATTGRTSCTTCKGFRVIRGACTACQGGGLSKSGGGGGGGSLLCATCKGAGTEPARKCSACPNGFIDCQKCEPLRKPPAVEDICSATPCALCEGRGLAFRRVAVPCKACLGLGQKLVPKADPTKVLAD